MSLDDERAMVEVFRAAAGRAEVGEAVRAAEKPVEPKIKARLDVSADGNGQTYWAATIYIDGTFRQRVYGASRESVLKNAAVWVGAHRAREWLQARQEWVEL